MDEPVSLRLMNTVWADRDGVHDALEAAVEARAWLRTAGCAATTTAELAKLRELRNALRRLAADAAHDNRAAALDAISMGSSTALRVVNSALAGAPRVVRLRRCDDGLALAEQTAAGSKAAGLLADIARDAAGLLTADPVRLRHCAAPGCVLYFVREHPRREWCSAACGNRVRAARHYRRRRLGMG